MNGGTCIDGVDNFTCSCPPQLTGALCDCLVTDDGTYDCEYIAPTPWPTHSVITTILFENSTSDVMTSTFIGNDTIARSSVTDTGETTIGTITKIESTTESVITEGNTEVTTEVATATVVTEDLITVTIDADNSQKETTTESSAITTPFVTEIDTTTETTTVNEDVKPGTKTTEESITAIDTTVNEVIVEVTSTPSGDSTDKMFTDVPTEHPTDLVTPPTYSTTEGMEITTGTETVTHGYTTVQSECTDSICNNHGTCVNSPLGIRVSSFKKQCRPSNLEESIFYFYI